LSAVRAVVCKQLGPPSAALAVEERDDPVAGPGQVVVNVEAAGVNFVDFLFVAGQYQIKPALPFVVGSEVAGTIESVGDDVTAFRPGDRVFAGVGLGGFANRAVVSAGQLFGVPDALSSPQAATFTQSYCTALFGLRNRVGVRPGETVLVLGAGGGVGLATIDVARALGAAVIGVASSAAKREAALAMGASATVDPAAEPLKERARELTEGRGVDVVVDTVGGALAEPALRALGDGGRFAVVGFASGTIPSLPLNQVLLRNRSVVGVEWGAWAMQNAGAQEELLATLLEMVQRDELHPVEPTTYSLDAAAQALEDLAERRVVGKVAIVP
jgi:NADPH:quinone reductase